MFIGLSPDNYYNPNQYLTKTSPNNVPWYARSSNASLVSPNDIYKPQFN